MIAAKPSSLDPRLVNLSLIISSAMSFDQSRRRPAHLMAMDPPVRAGNAGSFALADQLDEPLASFQTDRQWSG